VSAASAVVRQHPLSQCEFHRFLPPLRLVVNILILYSGLNLCPLSAFLIYFIFTQQIEQYIQRNFNTSKNFKSSIFVKLYIIGVSCSRMKYFEKNLLQSNILHHQAKMDWPGIEIRRLQWETNAW
jgi:hypothetical protein